MTDGFARKPLGGSNERRSESYQPRVAEINALEKEHEALSDAALRARSEEFKKQLAGSKPLDARRGEHDKHNLATGVRARMKSASLAARPPAKGSEG
jgi:SecA-like ATPase subunit of protein translocation complex